MIIYTVLIVLIAVIGVLMAIVILLQSGKGGGMAGIAGGSGGGGATQLLGARQAPDILEKATWVFATLFIVLCIGTNFFVDTAETRQSVIQTQSQQLPVAPPTATPPAGQQVPAPSEDGDSGSEQ
ncbi:MAG TPA: preprotein translocase subunit SecG [Rhodothermales bacterium]|nr:preprotein translocase subunit SecG [Rhodothermales bacterium]